MQKKFLMDAESDVLLICVLPNLFMRKEISVMSALDGSYIVLSAHPNGSGLSCWVYFGFCIHFCVRWLKPNDPFSPNETGTFKLISLPCPQLRSFPCAITGLFHMMKK